MDTRRLAISQSLKQVHSRFLRAWNKWIDEFSEHETSGLPNSQRLWFGFDWDSAVVRAWNKRIGDFSEAVIRFWCSSDWLGFGCVSETNGSELYQSLKHMDRRTLRVRNKGIRLSCACHVAVIRLWCGSDVAVVRLCFGCNAAVMWLGCSAVILQPAWSKWIGDFSEVPVAVMRRSSGCDSSMMWLCGVRLWSAETIECSSRCWNTVHLWWQVACLVAVIRLWCGCDVAVVRLCFGCNAAVMWLWFGCDSAAVLWFCSPLEASGSAISQSFLSSPLPGTMTRHPFASYLPPAYPPPATHLLAPAFCRLPNFCTLSQPQHWVLGRSMLGCHFHPSHQPHLLPTSAPVGGRWVGARDLHHRPKKVSSRSEKEVWDGRRR